jgi:hypothetical protein
MMKKSMVITMVLCLLFGLISCGKAAYEASYSADYAAARQVMNDASWEGGPGFNPEMPGLAKAYAVPEPAAPSAPSELLPADVNRKLTYTTHLTVRVDELTQAAETVAAMMKSYNAYSSSTHMEENRQTYYIRVPVTSYEAMLNQVNGLGKVDSRSDSADDVTLQYYDLEGRLNMRRELLKTYQDYLGRAANIEEILSVEQKIAELQNEIDMYGSQFTLLNNQIDYATIVLTLYGTSSAYTYEAPSIWDRIKDIFGGYSGFLSSAVIVIINIIVYGIPILAAAALLFWLLFGKIGLLRKLWRLVAKQKNR